MIFRGSSKVWFRDLVLPPLIYTVSCNLIFWSFVLTHRSVLSLLGVSEDKVETFFKVGALFIGMGVPLLYMLRLYLMKMEKRLIEEEYLIGRVLLDHAAQAPAPAMVGNEGKED
jgi:hypothetical protein